jgi:hypothetical protein
MTNKTKEDTMQSYLNDAKLKKDFVKEVKWHTEQDKVLQGTYGEGSNGDWRGCGVDLEPVKWKISVFILSENIERVLTLDISDDLKKQVVDSIRGILSLHETAIKTGVWDAESAWSAAESAAESAAWSAESAAWSAESAARSAAWSAESAARSAAWSAESAAWSAESAAYERYADKLIEILKASK